MLEEDGDTTKTKLGDVIFNPELNHEASEDVFLSTTSPDLANSEKLSWKYIVKEGVVWEVAREDEVDPILKKHLR